MRSSICARMLEKINDPAWFPHRLRHAYKRDINLRQRTILMDWIAQVCEKYRVSTETIFLTFAITDRALCAIYHDPGYENIGTPKFQLLGTTAFWITQKFNEIYVTDLDDLVRLCGKAYKQRDFITMETKILDAMGWQFNIPTPLKCFIVGIDFPFLKAELGGDDDAATMVSHRVRYATEFVCIHAFDLTHDPSKLACATLWLAILKEHQQRVATAAGTSLPLSPPLPLPPPPPSLPLSPPPPPPPLPPPCTRASKADALQKMLSNKDGCATLLVAPKWETLMPFKHRPADLIKLIVDIRRAMEEAAEGFPHIKKKFNTDRFLHVSEESLPLIDAAVLDLILYSNQ